MVLDFEPKHKELPTEEQEKRRFICISCDQNEKGQCYACACSIEKLTRYADGVCELEYW